MYIIYTRTHKGNDLFEYLILKNYTFFQYDETLKPSYVSVDLSEVELAEYDGPSAPPNNSLLLDVSATFLLFINFFITLMLQQ